MEARSLPSKPAPSIGKKVLLEIQRLAGPGGPGRAARGVPGVLPRADLTVGYAGYAHGHPTRIHALTYLGTNVVQGISNGAIWSLIAIGYTLVYGIIELINFAHGDVFMIGSFTGVSIWTGWVGLATSTLGLVVGLPLALLVCMIVCGALNVLIERVGYRPLEGAPRLARSSPPSVSRSSSRTSGCSGEGVRRSACPTWSGRTRPWCRYPGW